MRHGSQEPVLRDLDLSRLGWALYRHLSWAFEQVVFGDTGLGGDANAVSSERPDVTEAVARIWLPPGR
jgi:hypothetical protein